MKTLKLFLPLFLFFLISFVPGCTSNEIGESKDVAQETIFQQYTVSYNEGDENVAICARFRFAGDDGTTLVLTDPSGVQFDGVALAVDSSDFEGAFYKKDLLACNFFGNNQYRFTDIDKKRYDNSFSFDEFKLLDIPASAPKNQPLQFKFKASQLAPGDRIEIDAIETDSTFSVTYPGEDSLITIPVEELQRQKGGQIKLVSTLYKKTPLQQSTKEGGYLEMAYTLKPVIINLR